MELGENSASVTKPSVEPIPRLKSEQSVLHNGRPRVLRLEHLNVSEVLLGSLHEIPAASKPTY